MISVTPMASSTLSWSPVMERTVIFFTPLFFNMAVIRRLSPSSAPPQTTAISVFFSGRWFAAIGSVLSMQITSVHVSLHASTRFIDLSTPITSCPIATNRSASAAPKCPSPITINFMCSLFNWLIFLLLDICIYRILPVSSCWIVKCTNSPYPQTSWQW